MTQINKQPSGLSNFLGVQSGGQNPDDLSSIVRPVIDIEPFYTPDRLRAVSEAFSLNEGQIDFVEVPAGEVWKVVNLSLIQTGPTLNHTNIIFFGMERIPGQGLNGVPWLSAELVINQNASGENVFAADVVPRVITGGQRITLEFAMGDTTTINGTFWVTYVLLDRGS